MPLSMMGLGSKAIVTELSGKIEVRKFLCELGFVVGKQVEIIQYTVGNSMIVAIDGARLALDRKMAHHIQIMPKA